MQCLSTSPDVPIYMNIIMHIIMPTVQTVHIAKLIMGHLHETSNNVLMPHSREVGIYVNNVCGGWGWGLIQTWKDVKLSKLGCISTQANDILMKWLSVFYVHVSSVLCAFVR